MPLWDIKAVCEHGDLTKFAPRKVRDLPSISAEGRRTDAVEGEREKGSSAGGKVSWRKPLSACSSRRAYEVRPRKDKRGVDLISDALPFGRLWYGEPNAISNAIDYAKFRSRSHDAIVCPSLFQNRPIARVSRSRCPLH